MATAAYRGALDPLFQQTLIAIKTKKARVGVLGLGYVGLPLVRLFVKRGFPVVGFDCDPGKVEKLNAGQSYIKHIDAADVAEMRRDDRFQATSDMAQLGNAEAIV